MRRKIFQIEDSLLIDAVLSRADHGILALYDGKPYAVPVNFAWADGSIYFHGALKGRKAEILKANPLVGFTVVEVFSFVPSYFAQNNISACPATQFYKSVMLEGRIEILKNRADKVFALEALMVKFQPEGAYESWDNKMYDKSLETVMVVRLKVNKLTAKFKFAQNDKQEKLSFTIEKLKERGLPLDLETVEWIDRFQNR